MIRPFDMISSTLIAMEAGQSEILNSVCSSLTQRHQMLERQLVLWEFPLAPAAFMTVSLQ